MALDAGRPHRRIERRDGDTGIGDQPRGDADLVGHRGGGVGVDQQNVHARA